MNLRHSTLAYERNCRPRYNRLMHFAIGFMRVLEGMFFLGLVGSAVVVVISFFEDMKELVGDE